MDKTFIKKYLIDNVTHELDEYAATLRAFSQRLKPNRSRGNA